MRSLPALITSLLAGSALLAGVAATPTAVASPAVSCSQTTVPVSLGLLPETLRGQLCLPAGSRPTTVQVLLHGATYNRAYWDLPGKPERYSYQRDMAAHGYATFAVDRLGSGGSSHPLSVLLSGLAEAGAIHQLVGDLRAGRVGGTRFDRVVLVGHSAGSGLSVLEATTYHDVDGVVLTGVAHLLNVAVAGPDIALGMHPVPLDPQRARLGGDLGYLTTLPGKRGEMFYAPGDSDPGVVAADEASAKDQASVVAMVDAAALGVVSPLSRVITVPVLIVDGEKDSAVCGPLATDCSSAEKLRAQEAPFYDPAAHLSTYIVPGSGHSIALAENSRAYYAATRDWLSHRFGA